MIPSLLQDWSVDLAILTFAKERPCGIYKQDYLGDLFERYGDPDDCLEVRCFPFLVSYTPFVLPTSSGAIAGAVAERKERSVSCTAAWDVLMETKP